MILQEGTHYTLHTCALPHLQRTELAVWGQGQFESEVDLAGECVEQVDAVASAAVKVGAFAGRVEPGTQHPSTPETLRLALDLLRGDKRLLLDGQHLLGVRGVSYDSQQLWSVIVIGVCDEVTQL